MNVHCGLLISSIYRTSVLTVFTNLKEKLPQAFMQIEWMENDFRNLTVKSLGQNLDNPIKSYYFSKFWSISCMPPSQVALCWYLWCHQQYTCLMELYTYFTKFSLFMKMASSPLLTRYVRAKMIVHAFMVIELDQLDYWYPRKNKKFEILCTKSMERLFSCDITDSGIVPSREGDMQNFAELVLLNGLS